MRVALIAAVTVLSSVLWAVAADGPPAKKPIVCTRIYAPVCAVQNGKKQTYGNECEARGVDAKIVGKGPCAEH
jgi:Kazal-type serine protease inhibitor domain